MSLNWQVDDIKDYKNVVWIGEDDDAEMNPVTNALIWGTISVGLGSITDKNVDEFAARFRVLERIHGAFLYKTVEGKRQNWYVTDEEFTAHIGLTTNVRNETRAQWAQRIFVNKQTSITEENASSFRRNHNKEKVAS